MAKRTRALETDLPTATVFLLGLHSKEAGLKWMAFAIALVIHCTFLLVNFPTFQQALAPQKPAHYIVVRKYVPPPPKVEQQRP